ncbi:MAG: low molecular weight phosphotyrosine protein phosphatase [Zoogloeaceae bacterium]|jgi:protein-tyrosine phosphatase|nr:low molecular weight phosphotyrosine protein phosphatase [Zoogloeaceae bacterium]
MAKVVRPQNRTTPVRDKAEKYRVLFVCMGNVCRSPTAAGVFQKRLRERKLEKTFEVDSAGTHGYHIGEAPDSRTQRAAAARGYDLSAMRARKVTLRDFQRFDLVLAMDKVNLDNLRQMSDPAQYAKIRLFMPFARNFDDDEVPDPYYGLGYGFDLVIDMVEDAAEGLLQSILAP